MPVYSVINSTFVVDSKHSLDDIKKSIVRAGLTLGWKMELKAKGHLIATLYLRKHVAKVDINYNKKAYSIKYNDSKNLDYTGDSIPKNYNSWIKNLDRNIQIQLGTM